MDKKFVFDILASVLIGVSFGLFSVEQSFADDNEYSTDDGMSDDLTDDVILSEN